MFPDSLFIPAWIIIIIAAAFGAVIGLIVGGLMAKICREGIRSMALIFIDMATGAVGFILGASLSVTSNGSVYERWENGQLVIRETTGLIDYVYVFAVAGAVILVALVHFCKAIVKRLPCKRRPDRNHPDPIQAI